MFVCFGVGRDVRIEGDEKDEELASIFSSPFPWKYVFQRSYQRWLDKRILKTEMKFWAVLGSWVCREKNLPTAIRKQLFEVVFHLLWAKIFLKIF